MGLVGIWQTPGNPHSTVQIIKAVPGGAGSATSSCQVQGLLATGGLCKALIRVADNVNASVKLRTINHPDKHRVQGVSAVCAVTTAFGSADGVE